MTQRKLRLTVLTGLLCTLLILSACATPAADSGAAAAVTDAPAEEAVFCRLAGL